MKKQEQLCTGIALITLFFLLTACSATTINTQQGNTLSYTTHTTVETTTKAIATPEAATKSTRITTKGAQKPTKSNSTPTIMSANNMTLPPQATALPLPTVAPTTPPAPTPMPTSASNNNPSMSQAAQAVLNLINQERAGSSLPALTMSNALIQSAHKHNLAMLAANQLSHQLPGEADLGTRISAQRVIWNMVAENIGYGFGDAMQAAVSLNQSMFAEKPPNDGHRQNILSGNNIIGIDIIVNPQNSQVWLTEDFAHVS